ncbi:MAG: sulfite exporter TauE/SafE family protein [Anaerolineae bacterium]|nr:sulfite exporter TauE/SafE family protein [Anaerolineae bacterium]
MAWYLYPLIIISGFIAGFINTLAGSGSLVTLPVLIFLGLPANIANGTNRVAIIFQNIIGASGFHHNKLLDTKGAIYLGIPAIIGSLIGAQIAVQINETILRAVIGWLMLAMLFVILLRPKRWLHGKLEFLKSRPNWLTNLIFFLIGIYGGFIQAGVGIFLLAGLVLGVGYDLVRANAVKVGIVLLLTFAALFVFVINQQVNWGIGFILAIGNMVGAWTGTRVAAEKGAAWVRRLLIIIVAVSGANLLGLFKMLSNLF